jgi:putative transposase
VFGLDSCDGSFGVPFWRLHYHLIWTTTGREPLIGEEVERIIRASIASTTRSLKVIPHAVGMVSDHIHVVASIPPTVSISEVVGRLKGAASRAVNDGIECDTPVSLAAGIWRAKR